MIILVALIGLLAGWLLNWMSDYLPRLRGEQPSADQRCKWLSLHLSVELVSAVVFASLWWQYDLSWNLIWLAGGYAFFSLIALIDLKYRLVLNIVTYPAVAGILLVQVLLIKQNTLSVLLGGFAAFAIFFMTAWLRPGDLGMGDVKLAALIGFAFGFPQVLWALIVGAGTSGLVAVFLLLTHRWGRKSTIPYAPFLCLGAMVTLVYNPLLLTV